MTPEETRVLCQGYQEALLDSDDAVSTFLASYRKMSPEQLQVKVTIGSFKEVYPAAFLNDVNACLQSSPSEDMETWLDFCVFKYMFVRTPYNKEDDAIRMALLWKLAEDLKKDSSLKFAGLRNRLYESPLLSKLLFDITAKVH